VKVADFATGLYRALTKTPEPTAHAKTHTGDRFGLEFALEFLENTEMNFVLTVPSHRTALPYLKLDVVRKFFEAERKFFGSKLFGAPHFSRPLDELGQPDFAGSSRTSIPATRFDTAVPGMSVRADRGLEF
jgi:hypothetical protein